MGYASLAPSHLGARVGSMTSSNDLAEFLRRQPAVRNLTPAVVPPPESGVAWRGPINIWHPPPPTAADLGAVLLAAAEQEGIRLGGFFGTLPGHVLTSAVAAVIAPEYGVPFRLLVEALTLAAKAQQRKGEAGAKPYLVGAGLIGTLVLFALTSGDR